MHRIVLLPCALLLVAAPAVAQDTGSSRVTDTVNGRAGQRLTRTQATDGIEVTGRIAARVQNRVQSRIRNRIDRYYSPQANAASPFVIAGEQARAAGSPRRR